MPALKYETWSQDDAAREVPKRLKEALQYRKQWEPGWRTNELLVFGSNGAGQSSEVSISYDNLSELFAGDLDSGDSWITINYTFKYLRFLHSQMAANPPSVTPRPTSQDYKDRRTAEVADHLVTYGRRQYCMQDRIDLTSLQTLVYGTGYQRTGYDPSAGEILHVDRKSQELTMTGDFFTKPLLIWDVAIDHTARVEEDVRYWFNRHVMSLEEAQFRFPDYKDNLEQASNNTQRAQFWDLDAYGLTAKGRVAVWEYIEKGLPWNGMAGRRVFLLQDGTLVSDLSENPNPCAHLGLHILTDVDVPGQVYGKSVVDYATRLQDTINRLDSTVLDNIQAHGVVRMITYESAEMDENQEPSNSAWQVYNVKGSAAQKPDFVNPPTLMPDIYKFRQALVDGLDQIFGVNESMFGQIKRELSGFSVQTAINAGNMVRRRLYNKYTKFVESVYRQYLEIVKAEWSDQRKILVTGEEGALSVAYYSGADIESGYDLDVEYGASFSLDPASRREEIMQIMPMLKEAGYSMKSILAMLRLNDIQGLFDMAEVSARRQLEIFDEMVAKFEESGVLVYVAPRELEEHQGMLNAAYEFRMSMAFKVLARPLQLVVEKHIKAREALLAKAAAPAAPAAATGATVPPLGLGALPPMAAGAGGPAGLPAPAGAALGG